MLAQAAEAAAAVAPPALQRLSGAFLHRTNSIKGGGAGEGSSAVASGGSRLHRPLSNISMASEDSTVRPPWWCCWWGGGGLLEAFLCG